MTTPNAVSEPEVRELLEAHDQIQARGLSLLDGLSNDAGNWKPDPKRWSALECFQHINITEDLYHRKMQPAIASARERGMTGSGPFTYKGWLGKFLIRNMTTPPEKPFKAPGLFKPEGRSKLDVDAVRTEFLKRREEARALLRASDGLDLARVRFGNPMLGLIRMRLGQSFQIMAAHDRRHLWQAEQMLNAQRTQA